MCGLLAFSTALSAQTLPLPTLPEEPATVDPADPGDPTDPADPDQASDVGLVEPVAVTQERPRAWEYGLGVGAGWDSNVEFRVPDGPSSWAVSPRADLARVFWGRQGQLRIEGAGNWVHYPELNYPELEDASTYDATFRMVGSHRSSVNTTWRADGSYSLGYSDSSPILVEQGVLLPLVKTRTLAAALGVIRKLGPRTSFSLDGRLYRTVFDQNSTEAPGLSNGQSVRGTAGLERTLGQRDTMGLVYSLESTLGRTLPDAADREGSYYLSQYGSLQWTHLFSARSGFLLEGGASYTPGTEAAGLAQPVSFYGGVSYRRQVKSSSVTLFARREVSPAFGLGFSRLEDRFGLSTAIPVAREWTLRLSGTSVRPETPSGTDFTYATLEEAFVTLGRRIGRIFEISTEARYRRRGSTSTIPTVDEFRAGVFLSLLSPTGRSTAPAVVR
jgi:hypothetical protein